ncbi:hypothetical protein MKW94_028806, partial [Papaver nudicaule]|nr:hypothetical protein [Papaver nudicaule]
MSLRPPTTAIGGRRELMRKNSYKIGVDVEGGRRRREDDLIEIRKSKREDNLNKKRTQQQQFQERQPSVAGFGFVGNNQQQRQAGFSEPDKLDIQTMIGDLWSDNPEAQLNSTTKFRKLLALEHNPPIDEVVKAGVVPRFVEFLARHDLPQLQFEAAWAVTNIAAGTSEHTRALIEHGAIPMLVQILSSGNADVREQAVWALGNIAGDSPGHRDIVLSQGALVPLLSQFSDHSKQSMLRNATWTLYNFCRDQPSIPSEQIRLALRVLQHLIHSTDEEILKDACWALSHISNGTNDKIQAVIEAGVCPRLVILLLHPSPGVYTPSLRTIGNIVTGEDEQTQVVIDNQALSCFHQLLTQNYSKYIKKETCWAISNITAGNVDQIQAVIEASLIGPLVHLLRHAEFETKKEAAWAITNASCRGVNEQIR